MDAFIPELWSPIINIETEKAMVGQFIVNRDYQGEIANYGDTVRITRPGAVNVTDYDGNPIQSQKPTASQLSLLINKRKVFQILIDDFLKVQSSVDLIATYSAEAAKSMAGAVDADILNRTADVPDSHKIKPVEVKKDNISDIIADAGRVLDLTDTPITDRYIVISPDEQNAVLKAVGFTANVTPGLMTNIAMFGGAAIGNVLGFQVYMSNRLPMISEGSGQNAKHVRHILFGHKSAITLADQLTQVEQFRSQEHPADVIRGVYLYGTKTVRPEHLGVIGSIVKAS